MTIRIRQTPYERPGGSYRGPFQVYPDDVRGHLGVIAMAGSNELPESLAEDPDPNDPNFTVISYDPGPQDATTAAGRVRQILKDLVDRPDRIILVGVGPDFLWSDGVTLRASPGGAIGDLIIYDTQNCEGDGRWVRGTNGDKVCTTSAGILFHELGHVYLNHGLELPSEIEPEAVGVENELRNAQGLVPRDPNVWQESDCGCPASDCCIIASIATDSPFSQEVNELRHIRDHVLRSSSFGQHMFDILHEEYYSFSVSVCRVMVMDHVAKGIVADWLVKPLVQAYRTAWQYAQDPNDVDALGALVAQHHRAGSGLEADPRPKWEDALSFLQACSDGHLSPALAASLDPGTRRICCILAERLPCCPHVRWGIVDLLMIQAAAHRRYDTEGSAHAVGQWLKTALDEWAGDIPLDEILERISRDELLESLIPLAGTIFSSPPARRKFTGRLARRLNLEADSDVMERLHRAGFLT
jgi:hypothetical protein